MVVLPEFTVPAVEHRQRQENHIKSGKALKASIEAIDVDSLKGVRKVIPIAKEIVLAGDPRWANRQFGAVNTVQKSACVVFIMKAILDHFLNENIPIEDVLREVENKGYRMWKFEKINKTLNMPTIDWEQLKVEFPEIKDCKSQEEIYEKLGKPVGIGGSMFAIDNLIKVLSGNKESNTRITDVKEIFENISKNIPVPVRVNDSIYLNDPNKNEGRYIIIYGFSHGYAVTYDPSSVSGIRVRTIKTLFDAMIKNENLIAAWDLSSIG